MFQHEFQNPKVIDRIVTQWADTMTVPHSASRPRMRIHLRRGQEGKGIKTGRSQRKEERGPLAPALMMTRGPDQGRGERKRRSTRPSQNTRNPKRRRNLRRSQNKKRQVKLNINE